MKRLWPALLLLAGPALAGNGISSISVVKTRNLSSVAITAFISGDDDTSAVLRIFQQWDDGSGLDSGMVMVRRPTLSGASVHEGRILWMEPGRTVRFFIEGTDAAGSLNTAYDTVSCAAVRQVQATGPVFYVSPSGSDANPGTSASPKLTINGGLNALKASADSGAFGGVIVRPGEYHERVDLDFAGDGKPRFLMGDGTNRDSTIICGANEHGEAGRRDVTNNISWASRPDPNNTAGEPDSTFMAYLPATAVGSSYGDSVQLVVIGWGEQLHRKTSLAALFADSTFTGDASSTNQGELSGWYWAADTMYVKRKNGLTPTGSTIHFGYRDKLVFVKRRNWRVANLSIRYGGGITNQSGSNPLLWTDRANPGMNGQGVAGAVVGSGAVTCSGLALDSLKIYGCNARAIDLNVAANGARADSVTITNCYLDGLTVGAMGYGAGKSHAEENGMQMNLAGTATFVRGNLVTGTFNGIGFGTSASDSMSQRHCEASGNTITNIADDGIELDASHSLNMLVMGNTVNNAGSGVSFAAIYDGPCWLLYNTITNFTSRGIKAAGGTTGLVKAYQNTIASSYILGNTGAIAVDGGPGGSVDNLEFRNNILMGVGSTGNGSGVMSCSPGSGTFSTTTNSFNYNLLDSLTSKSASRLAVVGGTSYSLASLRTSLGWEANGQATSALLEDVIGGHSNPKHTSPAIRRGMTLPGINTAMGRKLYNGQPRVGSQPTLFISE